ncbi:hypothetical protein [Flavobacterium gyeonganense]|uniref:Lipoprotein n=1 Tax=Flavobacterium gyeonganense TaxID=1310418 RepID=A0ABV5H5L9_9FLAO|nr:hypothetical protein [Flavobacterium gyeonganense]
MMEHLLKPRFLISLIAFILISSCDTKEESVNHKTHTVHRLSYNDIVTVTKAISEKDAEIKSKKILASKFTPEPVAPELPYEEYYDFLAGQQISIEIDDRTAPILDQTYEENIQYLDDLNLFSTEELAIVTAFKDDLESTNNFNISISKFEHAILALPMTNNKLQRFYNFIDALKVMNNFDPLFFNGGRITGKSGKLFGSCLSATIGVGIAFVGLATIEVGSFGTATAFAVVGFVWASAEWGAACKGGGKKLVPPMKKPIKNVEVELIKLDLNGDLVTEPIRIFISPN